MLCCSGEFTPGVYTSFRIYSSDVHLIVIYFFRYIVTDGWNKTQFDVYVLAIFLFFLQGNDGDIDELFYAIINFFSFFLSLFLNFNKAMVIYCNFISH